MAQGLGFRDGLAHSGGYRVQGLGYRVYDVGFRVWYLEFRLGKV